MNEVKKPKKPLMIYYALVLIVLLLINMLQQIRNQKAKKQSLLQGLPILLLSICLLFAGCLCEAFINPSLMQWYQGL